MELNEGRRIRWFEVVYVLVLLVLLVASVFFMNPHRVAVVDGDRLFKELGVSQKLERARQDMDAFKRGTALLDAYNVRMKTLRGKLASAKTTAEKEKIEAQMKSASEQLQESVGPMQAQVQAYDANAVATFRRRVQPFIVKVAQKKRLDLVVYAGPSVLYYRNKADITSDVADAARSFFSQNLPLVEPVASRQPSNARE